MENMVTWEGKRVFVTGHLGFKGSWLYTWLRMLKARVVGYDIKYSNNDILDYENLFREIKAFKPEIIFHLAAQPLVLESIKRPLNTFETNIMGTAHVLEAARLVGGVKAIINVTSDKCYATKSSPHKEADPLGGNDPYSASKACSELISETYRRSYNLPVATARAGNVIGCGDWSENRLFPDIIRAIRNNHYVKIRQPYAVRPWQFVLEPLNGYLTLALYLYMYGMEYAEAWNFGPDKDYSVYDIVNIAEIADAVTFIITEDIFPSETRYLSLDSTKAKARLGWFPVLSIEEAIKWTIAGYNGKISWEDQILEFCKLVLARSRDHQTVAG